MKYLARIEINRDNALFIHNSEITDHAKGLLSYLHEKPSSAIDYSLKSVSLVKPIVDKTKWFNIGFPVVNIIGIADTTPLAPYINIKRTPQIHSLNIGRAPKRIKHGSYIMVENVAKKAHLKAINAMSRADYNTRLARNKERNANKASLLRLELLHTKDLISQWNDVIDKEFLSEFYEFNTGKELAIEQCLNDDYRHDNKDDYGEELDNNANDAFVEAGIYDVLSNRAWIGYKDDPIGRAKAIKRKDAMARRKRRYHSIEHVYDKVHSKPRNRHNRQALLDYYHAINLHGYAKGQDGEYMVYTWINKMKTRKPRAKTSRTRSVKAC